MIYLQGFNDITHRTNNKELQGQRNKTTRRTKLSNHTFTTSDEVTNETQGL